MTLDDQITGAKQRLRALQAKKRGHLKTRQAKRRRRVPQKLERAWARIRRALMNGAVTYSEIQRRARVSPYHFHVILWHPKDLSNPKPRGFGEAWDVWSKGLWYHQRVIHRYWRMRYLRTNPTCGQRVST